VRKALRKTLQVTLVILFTVMGLMGIVYFGGERVLKALPVRSTPTSTSIPTSALIQIPTLTQTLIPTQTTTPTNTPTPTWTSTPTSTPTLTLAQTPTPTPPTLFVTLNPRPEAGFAPLEKVRLEVLVSGSAKGFMTIFLDCTNDGSWEKIVTTSVPYYVYYGPMRLCSYQRPGEYEASVRVKREGQTVEKTSKIEVFSASTSTSTPTS